MYCLKLLFLNLLVIASEKGDEYKDLQEMTRKYIFDDPSSFNPWLKKFNKTMCELENNNKEIILDFFKKFSYHGKPSLWIMRGDHPGIDVGFKIHIGIQPYAVKKILNIFQAFLEKMENKKKIALKIGNPFNEKENNFFCFFSKPNEDEVDNRLQIGKFIVIYPEKMDLTQYKEFDGIKNKETLSNLMPTLDTAHKLNEEINRAIENKELKHEDFIPSVADIALGNVHIRFGVLVSDDVKNKDVFPAVKENIDSYEQFEDNRSFPLHSMFFEDDQLMEDFKRMIDIFEKGIKKKLDLKLYYKNLCHNFLEKDTNCYKNTRISLNKGIEMIKATQKKKKPFSFFSCFSCSK